MFLARTHLDLHNVRNNVERIKKLSDNVVGVGPFGVGLDAALNVLPNIGKVSPGVVYSAFAGGLLIYEGVRARATVMVLLQMAAILTIDALAPLFGKKGAIADAFFTGHKWSADLLLKHMEETIYFEGAREDVIHTNEYRDLMARVRSGQEGRRVVFLGDSPRRPKHDPQPAPPPVSRVE